MAEISLSTLIVIAVLGGDLVAAGVRKVVRPRLALEGN